MTFYNVFDRKTPRHKWRLVVSELNKGRADWVAQYQANKIREWGKWGDKWQVGMSEHESDYATDAIGIELAANSNNKPNVVYQGGVTQ
jgi:hypothetical protein